MLVLFHFLSMQSGIHPLGAPAVTQFGATTMSIQSLAIPPHTKKFVEILGRNMAYVDVGAGDPIVFLHGNPTSSYVWRNVIPHCVSLGRCLAPDLIGMGDSDKLPDSGPDSYTLLEHRRYLDAWFEKLGLTREVTLVVHDWGSALGFDWARRHPGAVKGIAYMEAIVMPLRWDSMPAPAVGAFKTFRSPEGEKMVLADNVFVEGVVPSAIIRKLSEEEMAEYRRPFATPGEDRRPTLSFPRQLPIEGEPAEVTGIVREYGVWLGETHTPKLFVNSHPGMAMNDEHRAFCRKLPNQTEVTVSGLHYVQEDSPDEIGRAIAAWYSGITTQDEGGKCLKTDTSDLFKCTKIGAIDVANRIVMAPMTRNRAGAGDVPHALNAEYYAQRADAGLIITEGSQISPEGKGYPGTPGIYSAEHAAGWRLVTDAVHRRGGRIFVQLWHVGRISHPSLQPNGHLPVAPSALKPAGDAMTESGFQPFVTPRALDIAEIPGIVATYRRAAINARDAGFDGVEIHAANGYLIDQFLRDGTNKRTDAYGGSVENRTRLLLEVVTAVSAVWGAERVGVRLSPVNPFNDMQDSDPQTTFDYVASRLAGRGLAYLHVYQAGTDPFDWQRLRRIFGGTFIVNSGYDRATAETALKSGAADLVAFGVPFIANPDLVERLKRNEPLNEANHSTFYGGGAGGYTDYQPLRVARA
jgi:N-ethylmaleimide reductase